MLAQVQDSGEPDYDEFALSPQYKSVAAYYRVLYINDFSRGNEIEARSLLERVADNAPLRYKARAVMSLGAIAAQQKDWTSAVSLYLDTGNLASRNKLCDPPTAVISHRMIAVIKSIDDDHRGAFSYLERGLPRARLVGFHQPRIFYDYLNSFAVELAEVSKIVEAQNISNKVISSPFAGSHCEWHETKREIAQKVRRASRPVVAVHRTVIEPDSTKQTAPIEQIPNSVSSRPQTRHEPASLIPFRNRESQRTEDQGHRIMPKINPIKYLHLSVGQKRALLVEVAQANSLSEEDLDRMLEVAGVIGDGESNENTAAQLTKFVSDAVIGDGESNENPRTINLEKNGTLEELISLWLSGELNVDDFAAVMSALRDCDDEMRRNNIIDRMISYAFHKTRDRMESEKQWRDRVEAKLEEDQHQN